jgi:hypothetical protein
MKKIIALAVCFIAIVALVSCGESKPTETDMKNETPATQSTSTENTGDVAMGNTYDCKYFTMTLADDWEAGPETFGMVNVLPKGKISPGLYFKFEGPNTAGTAEESIIGMIKTYNGTPMESTTIAGMEFMTTTYTYSNMFQVMHVAYRDSTKITITLEGEGVRDLPEIKAMLESVVLK